MSQNFDNQEFLKNLSLAAEQGQRVFSEFLQKNSSSQNLPGGLSGISLLNAYIELMSKMYMQPEKLVKLQLEWYKNYAQVLTNFTARMLGENTTPVYQPQPRDKRFKDVAWNENVIFDYIKQSYLLTSNWLQKFVNESEGLDKKTAQKLDFYTRQFIDAMAPSNFLMTNPEALRATAQSNGHNLVNGFKNLLDDLEKSKSSFNIKQTDYSAFKVGKNLAYTPGKVIFQNDLMQLIQYNPSTEKVYKTPVLCIPAWINKYYIMDMNESNSLVKWLVGQGYTVFVISWVNPDKKLAAKSFENYMFEGPLAAIEAIEKATGQSQVSVMAYCLGGTLMASTLSYMFAKGLESKVKSVTYLTTLVDFKDSGDLSVFIDEEQVSELENRMNEKGYLEGAEMSNVFNMLRANDLIWSYVVNNYMLGREPMPFDLLYWNADSTRMPAKMHSFYLRNMYLKNLLSKPGGIKLGGVDIDLKRIKTPTYILSTREDHIAPWRATFYATKLYSGPVKFVLSASGHVAGVINPAGKSKYNYWTDENGVTDKTISPEKWFEKAKENQGSWWLNWAEWNKKFAGEKVSARKPGTGKLKVLEDAPGSYVKVNS